MFIKPSLKSSAGDSSVSFFAAPLRFGHCRFVHYVAQLQKTGIPDFARYDSTDLLWKVLLSISIYMVIVAVLILYLEI